MSADYSESITLAHDRLRACYAAAQAQRMAEAIRFAFEAQAACTQAAEALERLRVQMDGAKRAENAPR